MTVTELGSMGEFVSAIAILITLIYLAIQARQTRRETAASLLQRSRLTNSAKNTENDRRMPKIMNSARVETITTRRAARSSHAIKLSAIEKRF